VNVKPLSIAGAFEIVLQPIVDARGYFKKTFDRKLFREHGLHREWLQENESLSQRKGTIRGLHFQTPPHTETKLIRVVQGAIMDVVVDLRRGSPTFARWDSVEVAPAKHNLVFVPWGCAHGFCTLTDHCVVIYKVDRHYVPEAQGCLRWNDPEIAIDWPEQDPILSDRDRVAPLLADLESPFLASQGS
jgi:dTDP-4-dehydrorhamnose 3,5-epimerase